MTVYDDRSLLEVTGKPMKLVIKVLKNTFNGSMLHFKYINYQ